MLFGGKAVSLWHSPDRQLVGRHGASGAGVLGSCSALTGAAAQVQECSALRVGRQQGRVQGGGP